MNYAKRIIDRMGGPTKAARLIGKPTSTVKSWCEAGSIPDRHKADVYYAAVEAGCQPLLSNFVPDSLRDAWRDVHLLYLSAERRE